jgi:hypothetical protein
MQSGYSLDLQQNLLMGQDWVCISVKVLWKLMVARYGLKIIQMVEELPLHLVYQLTTIPFLQNNNPSYRNKSEIEKRDLEPQWKDWKILYDVTEVIKNNKMSNISCRQCNQPITFDNKHVSQRSSKKIPLDVDTNEPHDCPARKSRQQQLFSDGLSNLSP